MSLVNVYRVEFHYTAGGQPVPRESFQQAYVMLANGNPDGYATAPDSAAVVAILTANALGPPSGSTTQIDSIANVLDRVLM